MVNTDWIKKCSRKSQSSLFEEYAFMQGICTLLRPRNILEVGTCAGIGTLSLAIGAGLTNPAHKAVTTVDLSMSGLSSLIKKNFKACGINTKCVEFIEGDSRRVLADMVANDRWFDLIFLDGCHNDPVVSADWLNVSKLSNFILLHDVTQKPDVHNLIDRVKKDDKFDVISLDIYPFGHKWNTKGDTSVFKVIPGIAIAKRKGSEGLRRNKSDEAPGIIQYLNKVEKLR